MPRAGASGSSSGEQKLQWLEAMRGVAACWVLLTHAAQSALDFHGVRSPQVLVNGYLGVDFFFVLSGFIIATSAAALVQSGRGWGDYAAARAVRIYVPYLPVGAGMLALYAIFPGVSHGTRGDVGVLTSLTLLPSNSQPALAVAWSLVHEMIFYGIFSAFFVSRRALLVLLAAWAGAIVWAWATKAMIGQAAGYLLSPLNLCFMLGVGLAWLTAGGIGNRGALVAGLSGLVLVGSQAAVAAPDRVLVAVGFAGMVAAARAPLALRTSPGRILLLLGAASYAIYLVHSPVISALARAARGPLVFFVLVAGGLVAGLAYHLLYERAALRWVRAQISRTGLSSPNGTRPASPSVYRR